jgi:hypothetical protein
MLFSIPSLIPRSAVASKTNRGPVDTGRQHLLRVRYGQLGAVLKISGAV